MTAKLYSNLKLKVRSVKVAMCSVPFLLGMLSEHVKCRKNMLYFEACGSSLVHLIIFLMARSFKIQFTYMYSIYFLEFWH